MSATPRDEERDLRAAEYALGLLDAQAMREARVLAATDPEFAEAVARWESRLAPLFDEVPAAEPAHDMWARIERAIPVLPAGDENVVQIGRSLRRWRSFAGGMTAIAASLAVLVGYQAMREGPVPIPATRPAPVLVASLSSEQANTSLSVAYEPRRFSLLVTPGQLTGAPGHDHELWIIPAGGSPVSLGLVRAGAPARIQVPARLAPHFRSRSTIALSVEPVGGSPTGQPTGPVVAAGELVTI